MKPIYLLLLLLMAYGFFACTTDLVQQDQTEIAPISDRKTLDATAFAEIVDAMVDLDLFDEEEFTSSEDYGVMDLRLFIQEDGESLDADFLFDDGFEGTDFVEDLLSGVPDRAWEQTISLQFDIKEAARLNTWLNHHFTGTPFLDLRIIVLPNGTITVQGLRPSTAEREAHPPVPLF